MISTVPNDGQPPSDSLDYRLNVLKAFVELAERRVAMCNVVIHQVVDAQLLSRTALLGQTLQLQSASSKSARAESSQLVQAALLIPGGFGVVMWDDEKQFRLQQRNNADLSPVWRRFIPFDDCSRAFREFVGAQYGDLLAQFVRLI